jgi:hypothetical protein
MSSELEGMWKEGQVEISYSGIFFGRTGKAEKTCQDGWCAVEMRTGDNQNTGTKY